MPASLRSLESNARAINRPLVTQGIEKNIVTMGGEAPKPRPRTSQESSWAAFYRGTSFVRNTLLVYTFAETISPGLRFGGPDAPFDPPR